MRKAFFVGLIIIALEIATFILVGKEIGVLPVFVLIIATSLLGVTLAKKHGKLTLQQAQYQIAQGQVPGDQLFDGLCILIGGLLLILPGFITDIIGLLFVVPFTRAIWKDKLYTMMKRKLNGRTIIYRR